MCFRVAFMNMFDLETLLVLSVQSCLSHGKSSVSALIYGKLNDSVLKYLCTKGSVVSVIKRLILAVYMLLL